MLPADHFPLAMTKTALAALLLLSLAACASRPPLDGRGAGVRSEQEIIITLSEVQATPEQRATVLAAFDKALPELRGLQAERTALQAQLQSLSPKQPDYATRSDALAKQWGALHEREVLAYARFESAVAGALDDRQWGRWREFSSEMRFVGRGFDDGGMERRRR